MRHLAITLGCAALLAACASQTDHFYTLNPLDAAGRVSTVRPTVHVLLDLTVPSMVDRSEMVINTANDGVEILDHQRWAAPLADEMANALARDIEGLRPTVMVADKRFDQGMESHLRITVEIVRATVARGGRASIEAHWRIADATRGMDQIGSGIFDAPVSGSDYASIAAAYRECLQGLAARLVGDAPLSFDRS